MKTCKNNRHPCHIAKTADNTAEKQVPKPAILPKIYVFERAEAQEKQKINWWYIAVAFVAGCIIAK